MISPLFVGKNLIELESVDSTNSYAKELLSNSRPPEGTAIMAKDQHSGRGQMGNSWAAEPGQNITVSFILYPEFLETDRQFFLNMAVSLAVKDFCEFILKDEVKIKWPNDIYYLDKKLGGILIENSISGTKIASSVIGIGLNVNQVNFNPALPNPVSFALLRQQYYNLQELQEQLSSFLEKYYLQLRQLHFNFLDSAYTQGLYRYQQTHEFKKGEQILRGEITGVTKEGKLVIDCNGKEHKFNFKEIEYVI